MENLQVETDNLDLSKFLTNTSYLDLGKLREYYEKSGRVMSCKFCSYWTVSDIALEFHESKCSVLLLDQVIGNVGRLTPAGTKGKRVKQISVGTAFEKKVTKMELDQ